MKMNDPFGRLGLKREREYAALCASLKSNSVDTREDAERVLQNMRKRAITISVVMFVGALFVAVLFPDAFFVALTFAVLIFLWLISTTVNGYRYIRRYIEEELG